MLDNPFIAPICHEQIKIIYQDNALLFIDKPTGLLSLSGKNPANLDSVHHRIVQSFPSSNLVHRLDLGTSGLLIIALTKAVNGHIGKQFQDGAVTRSYTAILDGIVKEDEGVIKVPIAKGIFPLQKVCYETGKKAATHYQVLERNLNNQTTRVLFTPITGRTHQLRVHSEYIGHPILGCDLYGTEQTFKKASRMTLHATTIRFEHPTTGGLIDAFCPAPF